MARKEVNKTLVDDKKYWKDRHKATGNLSASGLKTVNSKSNLYIYKMLQQQFDKVLSGLELKSALDCGFGDGFFLLHLATNHPSIQIQGVDISSAAKAKVEQAQKLQSGSLHVSDIASFSAKTKVDMVYSFDVLYHILNDRDHEASLISMAKNSKRYVVLHEKFPRKAPLIASKHVRMRSAEQTTQILNAQGFYLKEQTPTHFFAMRWLTFNLNKLMPGLFFRIDQFIVNNLHPSTQEHLGTHFIRVYEKRKNNA